MTTWLREALEATARDDVAGLSAIVDEHCLSRGHSPLPLLIATDGHADLATNSYMRALICGRIWKAEEVAIVDAIRVKLLNSHLRKSADVRWIYYGLGRGRQSRSSDHYITIAIVGEKGSGKDAFATRLAGMWWRRATPTVSGSPSLAVRFIQYSPLASSPGSGDSLMVSDASGMIALTACDTCDPVLTSHLAQITLNRLGRMPCIHVTSKCDLLETVPPGGTHISARASPIEDLCKIVDSLLALVYPGPIASVRVILLTE